MDPRLPQLDRREFLARTSAWAALLAAHGGIAWGDPAPESSSGKGKETGPRILSLELLTSAPLAQMKEFYRRSLGLRVLDERSDRLAVDAGETRLTFVEAGPDGGRPFYHFAFNIPENKLLAARAWQKERTPLIQAPARLRDPGYPDDVIHFKHWNAHSVFFLDPGGNVVEYIARHDLKNAAGGSFESEDILHASEIGLIVDDVPAAALKLREVVGLEQYRGGDEQFTAIGDEHGLLLVIRRGRTLNFNPSDPEKAARVFRTVARVRGVRREKVLLPHFPYEVSVEG